MFRVENSVNTAYKLKCIIRPQRREGKRNSCTVYGFVGYREKGVFFTLALYRQFCHQDILDCGHIVLLLNVQKGKGEI